LKRFVKHLDGNAVKVRPRRRFLEQTKLVLEKGHAKSVLNQRACIRNLMKVHQVIVFVRIVARGRKYCYVCISFKTLQIIIFLLTLLI
jgi:hypothetical protein